MVKRFPDHDDDGGQDEADADMLRLHREFGDVEAYCTIIELGYTKIRNERRNIDKALEARMKQFPNNEDLLEWKSKVEGLFNPKSSEEEAEYDEAEDENPVNRKGKEKTQGYTSPIQFETMGLVDATELPFTQWINQPSVLQQVDEAFERASASKSGGAGTSRAATAGDGILGSRNVSGENGEKDAVKTNPPMTDVSRGGDRGSSGRYGEVGERVSIARSAGGGDPGSGTKFVGGDEQRPSVKSTGDRGSSGRSGGGGERGSSARSAGVVIGNRAEGLLLVVNSARVRSLLLLIGQFKNKLMHILVRFGLDAKEGLQTVKNHLSYKE